MTTAAKTTINKLIDHDENGDLFVSGIMVDLSENCHYGKIIDMICLHTYCTVQYMNASRYLSQPVIVN